jgi:hypothetical protein
MPQVKGLKELKVAGRQRYGAGRAALRKLARPRCLLLLFLINIISSSQSAQSNEHLSYGGPAGY